MSDDSRPIEAGGTRMCSQCEAPLPPSSAARRMYCSNTCRKRAQANLDAICASCGAAFKIERQRLNASGDVVFCSRSCQGKHATATGMHRGPSNSRWKHGRSRASDSTYWIWKAMIARCTNPASTVYRYYGGRGIKVCDRWRQNFEAFLADMGERPPGLSIDRINNDGNYEPGNCRWAAALEQARNSRRCKVRSHHRTQITWLRECGLPQREIAELLGFGQSTVSQVLIGRPGSTLRAKVAAGREAERCQVTYCEVDSDD